MTVNEVIADTAYSTLENLKDAQSNDYKLISKLNPCIIKGTRSEDGFIFNKDADIMQCPAGHLAIKYRIDRFMANPGIWINGLIITINLIIQNFG